MASVNHYIFGTIIEVDIRLRIIYIESFAGEKSLAVLLLRQPRLPIQSPRQTQLAPQHRSFATL